MLSALRRIRSAAQTEAAKYAPTTCNAHVNGGHPIHDLSLTIPSPLKLRLVALGISVVPAERISSALMDAIVSLKRSCEVDFERRRQILQSRLQYISDSKFASLVPATYEKIFHQTVHQWSSYLLEEIAPRVIATQNLLRQQQGRRFNPSAIPLLERFFNKNPFPSRLEKLELASQCQMRYRQIDVWFQNHRSRLRKEGKCLKRPEPPFGLRALEDVFVDAVIPEVYDADGDSDSVEENATSSFHNTVPPSRGHFLPCSGPEHAFPAPYPPHCSYDPFPSGRDLDLPWPRPPVSTSLVRSDRLSGEVSDLIDGFAALSIHCDKTSEDRTQPRAAGQHCIGFAVICPRAPHPASVRNRSSRPVGSSCRSARKRLSSVPLFSSPPAPSMPRRERRTLPRRIPRNPPYGWYPTVDRVAKSRSSSISSTLSQATYSDSDNESLPPKTPPHPSNSLPHAVRSPSVPVGTSRSMPYPHPQEDSSEDISIDWFGTFMKNVTPEMIEPPYLREV